MDLSMKILKADLHGAVVKVVSSLCSPFVGIEGILVQETQNTFKIITRENKCKGTG